MGVGRIAGEKDAAVHEAVGDRALSHPQILVLDSVGNVAAHAAPHQRGDVGFVQALFVEIDKLQPPEVLAVHNRQKRPGALGPDEHVAKGSPLVVLRMKIGNAQIDGHRPVDVQRAADLIPSSSRTVLEKPSQPIRYWARTISVAPVFSSFSVAVTPSGSCTKLSSLHAMAQRDVRI